MFEEDPLDCPAGFVLRTDALGGPLDGYYCVLLRGTRRSVACSIGHMVYDALKR